MDHIKKLIEQLTRKLERQEGAAQQTRDQLAALKKTGK